MMLRRATDAVSGAAKLERGCQYPGLKVKFTQTKRKRYSHKDVGVVGNFSQWESVAILITCVHKTLEKILATSRVPFSDALLDLADHAPGVVLHSSLLDNLKLGEGPDPRKVRPEKLLERDLHSLKWSKRRPHKNGDKLSIWRRSRSPPSTSRAALQKPKDFPKTISVIMS